MAPYLRGIFQAPQHIGGAAGGGNANHQILLCQMDFLQIQTAQGRIVLCPFHRPDKGLFAPGDQPHHQGGVHPEGRGTFHRIQHPKTAAGSGSHIDNSPPGLYRGNPPDDTLGDMG